MCLWLQNTGYALAETETGSDKNLQGELNHAYFFFFFFVTDQSECGIYFFFSFCVVDQY